MKERAAVVLILAATCWGQSNATQYPVTVHVISSYWVIEQTSIGPRGYQKLNVTIDGRKLECKAEVPSGKPTLLAVGDYKAKLVEDIHKRSYESMQTYEFRFADNTTRKFMVTGQSE
jgi:hypothetical protein